MKNTIRNGINTGLVGLSTLISANAQTPQGNLDRMASQFDEGRVKSEFNSDFDDRSTVMTTLGFGPKGTYSIEGKPQPSYGQIFEAFRLYDTFSKGMGNARGAEWSHWTAAGFRSSLNIGGLDQKFLVYGVGGDKQGIGFDIEPRVSEHLSLNLVVEESLRDNRERIGGGINLQIGKPLTINLGYDEVSKSGINQISQPHVRIMYDITPNDAVGFAFAEKNMPGNTEHGVGMFYAHWGKDKTWGGRVYEDIRSDEKGNFAQAGHVIFAPNKNCTVGKMGIAGALARVPSEDGAFNNGVLPTTVNRLEKLETHDRTYEGLAFRYNWKSAEAGNKKSGYYSGDVAYNFKEGICGGRLGVTAGMAYNWSNFAKDGITFNPSFAYRLGNVDAEAGLVLPLNTDDKPMVRFGLQGWF
ncbi:MAG: hypothetical protein AABX11_02305 [Nanoarchaeota archaeon]